MEQRPKSLVRRVIVLKLYLQGSIAVKTYKWLGLSFDSPDSCFELQNAHDL